MTSKITMLVAEIISGEYDGDFDAIYAAIRNREQATRASKANLFSIGDRVRFNRTARPKYLQGVEGEVSKVNKSTVVVKIGPEGGRFANGPVRCPIDIVDKVVA